MLINSLFLLLQFGLCAMEFQSREIQKILNRMKLFDYPQPQDHALWCNQIFAYDIRHAEIPSGGEIQEVYKKCGNIRLSSAGPHIIFPLHEAVKNGYARALAVLLCWQDTQNLKASDFVNTPDYTSRAPLHYIAFLEDEYLAVIMAEQLILYNANIHQRDVGGYTPLHQAIDMDRNQLVEYLCEAGACDQQEESGNFHYKISSPLVFAASRGKCSLVTLLVKYCMRSSLREALQSLEEVEQSLENLKLEKKLSAYQDEKLDRIKQCKIIVRNSLTQ